MVWVSVLVAVVLLAAVATATAWQVFQQVGRTPGEIIEYGKRRLQGHPTLQTVALPALEWTRRRLGEPDPAERQALPFVVPPLAPNPATPEPAVAGDEGTRIIRVGPQRAITRIGVAAKMAVDGSVIEIDPGDYVADVAVWDRAALTIRGTGNRVRLLAAGASAEGKAIWVVRRGRVTIENIEFIGARVADRNGAGIRHEAGDLVVRRCRFIDNETGILTGGQPDSTLVVEHSEFGYNGAGDGKSHGIYVNKIASFRLTGSYLHHGNVGHLVKSRARVNRIEYNRITDESGGRASYELEFPNGGVAEVVGNVIQQGTDTRNSTIVSYGAEGYVWRRNELGLAHNTIVNDQPAGGSFLRVAPGAGAVTLRNNLFVGAGKVDDSAAADAAGDRMATWAELVRPAREDYRLNLKARAAWQGQAAAAVPDALRPAAEYRHPRALRPLDAAARWPGALQSAPP